MKRILTPIALVALTILGTSLWSVRQDRATLSDAEKLTLRDSAREVNELDIEEILRIGREAQAKGIKPAPVKGSGSSSSEGVDLEGAITRDGYKQAVACRDGLREDLRDKVRVWSWVGKEPRPLATRHVWVFPAELFAPRNLPVPVPALESGEKEAAPAADELRCIVHYVATSRPSKTLYFDLDQQQKVELKDGMPQNHPYAQAGYVNGGNFSIPDEGLLKDALARAKFPVEGKTYEQVSGNLKKALQARQGGESYSITGTVLSGSISLTLGQNREFLSVWPKLDQRR